LPETHVFFRAQSGKETVARKQAVLARFCDYLTGLGKRSRSAPVIREVLVNGY